jgi:hypothetical protein
MPRRLVVLRIPDGSIFTGFLASSIITFRPRRTPPPPHTTGSLECWPSSHQGLSLEPEHSPLSTAQPHWGAWISLSFRPFFTIFLHKFLPVTKWCCLGSRACFRFSLPSLLSSCIILTVFISLLCHQSRHRLPPTTTIHRVHAEVFAFAVAAARCLHHHKFSRQPEKPAISSPRHSNITNPSLNPLTLALFSTVCPSLTPWSLKLPRRCYTTCSHLNSAIPAIVVEISDMLVCCALGVGVEVSFLTCFRADLW